MLRASDFNCSDDVAGKCASNALPPEYEDYVASVLSIRSWTNDEKPERVCNDVFESLKIPNSQEKRIRFKVEKWTKGLKNPPMTDLDASVFLRKE